MPVRHTTGSECSLSPTLPTPNTMEHREVKTPEQIAELKERSPGGYRNLREVVINELDDDSLFRTPSVTDSTGGAISETQARERNRMVKVADQVAELAFENGLKVSDSIAASLLPTPAVAHVRNHDEPIENYLERRQDFIDGKTKGMPGASLGVAVRMNMLPTPLVDDAKNTGHNKTRINTLAAEAYDLGNSLLATPVASEGTKAPAQQTSDVKSKTGQVWLSNQAKDIEQQNKLFPTLRASDGYERRNRKTMQKIADEGGDMTMPTLAAVTIDWGKFEPAIKRWESVLQREAPAPTKPDGKNGAHRLSSEFTEWMMGLPAGWITGVGLKRNDELKACGNGVVPQQAELALRMLLTDIPVDFASRGGHSMLPTPTVSDIFTGNLKSSQQKEGSMHSVTLPQAIERLLD